MAPSRDILKANRKGVPLSKAGLDMYGLRNKFSMKLSLLMLLIYIFTAHRVYGTTSQKIIVGRTTWIRRGEVLSTTLQKKRQAAASKSALFFKSTFEAPKITSLKNNLSRIEMPALLADNARAGAPILPFKSLKLLIPFGYKATGIKVTLGPKKQLSGEYLIEAAGKPQPIEETDYINLPDPEIYGQDNVYPKAPCGDAFIQTKHGFMILLLNLFPVEYYPLSHQVAYYQEMHIEVELVAQEAKQKFAPDIQSIEDIRSFVDNPEVLKLY